MAGSQVFTTTTSHTITVPRIFKMTSIPDATPATSRARTGTTDSLSDMSPFSISARSTATHTRRQMKRDLKNWLLENGFMGISTPKSSRRNRTLYPLHAAVKQNNPKIVKLLVEAGADPQCETTSGRTPLQIAKSRNWTGSYNAVIELLQNVIVEHDEESSEESSSATAPGCFAFC